MTEPTYLLVCPGPSAKEYIQEAFDACGNNRRVASCNGGVLVMREYLPYTNPDIYMVIEQPAVMEYYKDMRQAALAGKDVWTWPSRTGECHGFQHKVRALKIPKAGDKQAREARKKNIYLPGFCTHATTVGVTLLTWLVDHYKAKNIHVVGMDSYDIDELYDSLVDYAPVSPPTVEHCVNLNELGGQFLEQVMQHKANSGVQFTFYGPARHRTPKWRCKFVEHTDELESRLPDEWEPLSTYDKKDE